MGTRRIRRRDGEYTLFFRKVSPFSNHHPAEFDCDESINFPGDLKRFTCTEQYYMYNKACLLRDEQLMKAVLECDSPRAMKTMCSKGALRGWSDARWNQHKENVMYTGCLAKFSSCQHLRYALFLSTGSQLVECSPFDVVWGIGKDLEMAEKTALDSGTNLLGKILDRVREELWNEDLYRDEREEVEKRMREDVDYLMKAMEQVDLLYKDRAKKRYQISTRKSFAGVDSIVTSEMKTLIPDWALPPTLEESESIRPSPPQITHFARFSSPVKRSRSISPPAMPESGSRLFGRLTKSEMKPRRRAAEVDPGEVEVRKDIVGKDNEMIREDGIAVSPDRRSIGKGEEKKREDRKKDVKDGQKTGTRKDREDQIRTKRAVIITGIDRTREKLIGVLGVLNRAKNRGANDVVSHHLQKNPNEL